MSQGQTQPQRRPVYHPPLPRLPATSFLEKIYGEIAGQADFKWGIFSPWVKAKTLTGTWQEWNMSSIVNAEPSDLEDLQEQAPTAAKRRFEFENELQYDVRPSHIDVAELLDVTEHPDDYSDEFFETHYKNLYVKTVEFVTKWFDCNVDFSRIPNADFVWESNLTPQFLQYTRLVAQEDRTKGGWSIIMNNPAQRRWLIVGIISQIMEKKIFNELLFGADPKTQTILEYLDTNNIEQEGYFRKAQRAVQARFGLASNLVAKNFWVGIDELAAKSTKIFLPLLNVMKEVRPAIGGAEAYTLQLFLQELHYILGYAGIIHTCAAISPTIFQFLSATPGARMDFAIETQADIPMYAESRDFHNARERRWETLASAAARGQNYELLPNEAFTPPRNAEELATMKGHRLRGAKVKFAVFPKLTRYIPENKSKGSDSLRPDPRIPMGEVDFDMQQGTVEGQSIVELTNCVVVYYQGLIKPDPTRVDAYSLDDHIKSLGEESSGLVPWGFHWLWKLLKLIYVGARHGVGLLPVFIALVCIYSGFDYGYYLLRTHPAILLFLTAITSFWAKMLIDKYHVGWGILVFLLPLLFIGLGGFVTAGSSTGSGKSSFGDAMIYVKDSFLNLLPIHRDVSADL